MSILDDKVAQDLERDSDNDDGGNSTPSLPPLQGDLAHLSIEEEPSPRLDDDVADSSGANPRSSRTPSDSFSGNAGPSHNNATRTSNPALGPKQNPRSLSTTAKSRLTPRSASDRSQVSGTVGSASAVLKVIDAGLLRKALKIQGGTAVKAQNICTFL